MNINNRKTILIVYVILVAVTLAVYWQVNKFDFVNLDDPIYVTGNPHIRSGITLNGLLWAFHTTDAEFWHPVTWLSLMLDSQLYGLNAAGYHFTNLLLHVLSTLLLFWLFNRMTGTIWRSAFVAAFFALHPLHVETVAWITKRKDVLSGFLWMMTLCLYVYYSEKPVIRRYLLVLFSFILALMSKSMVVTMPFIMILLDYWPLGRFQTKQENFILWQMREKTPFFIFAAVFSFITIRIRFNWDNLFISDLPLKSRLVNAPVSFATYLKKIFWPHDLAVFYPFSDQIPVWQIFGSVLLIIIISAFVFMALKRLPCLFAGWLWYAITIFPVIGIIQVGNRSMSDNYTYLPSIGISLMLAWGMSFLFRNEEIRKRALLPLGALVLVILSVLTWRQCGYWQNSITLFNHELRVTKDNYLAHDNLASALIEEGNLQEALYHCNKSIREWPKFEKSYFNRGLIHLKQDQYPMAIEDFNTAIRLKPDFAAAYYKRGIAYGELGQNRLAIKDFYKAILINPAYIYLFNNIGSLHANKGNHGQAIEFYNEAIRLQPNNALAYNNRGVAYLTKGNFRLGCRDANKACTLGNCTSLKIAKSKGDCP